MISTEFRVFPTRIVDIDGQDLSQNTQGLPRRFYEALLTANADAGGAPEFIFNFRRVDFDLNHGRDGGATPPVWLRDCVYRVVAMQTARGRLFQLSPVPPFDSTLLVKFDQYPESFVAECLLQESRRNGLVLISGPSRGWRTTIGIALARYLANDRKVQAILCETSPRFIFDEVSEPYVTQLIGDNGAAETLAALEHRATSAGRVVFIDNVVQRGLAPEAVMLANRGYLVLAVVDDGQNFVLAEPIETLALAASTPYAQQHSAVAEVLRGVLRNDPSQVAAHGLRHPMTWSSVDDQVGRLIRANDYHAVQESFEKRSQIFDVIAARAGNVARLRPTSV